MGVSAWGCMLRGAVSRGMSAQRGSVCLGRGLPRGVYTPRPRHPRVHAGIHTHCPLHAGIQGQKESHTLVKI